MQITANKEYASGSEVADAEWNWQQKKRRVVERLLRELPLESETTFLEVGCRDGRSTQHFGETVGATRSIGVDLSLAASAQLEARGVEAVAWVAGESDLAVEDSSVDLVLAMDVIEHVLDPEELLTPLRRVLKDGGWLVLTTPNLAWWWNRVRLLRGVQPVGAPGVSGRHAYDNACDRRHIRVGTLAEWTGMLEAHGFSDLTKRGYNYPRHLRFPTWLLDDLITLVPGASHSFALAGRCRK